MMRWGLLFVEQSQYQVNGAVLVDSGGRWRKLPVMVIGR
jgi:hypothetical protein